MLPRGEEGLLVDTGAVSNVCGQNFVDRQAAAARENGQDVQYTILDEPKQFAGVGGEADKCRTQARVPGVLENGAAVDYCAPVMREQGSSLPAIFALDSMASMRTYFGSHNGLMAMVPEGCDEAIAWQTGTRFIQCRKAPSGHWMIIVSA